MNKRHQSNNQPLNKLSWQKYFKKNVKKVYFVFLTGLIILTANFYVLGISVTNSSWASDGSGSTTDRPIAINFQNNLYQIARGSSNKLYIRCLCYNSVAALSSWLAVPNSDTKTSPAASVFGGRLWIAALGNQNTIYTTSTADGSSFNSWTADLSSQTSLAPALATVNNSLYLSAVGFDRKIYTKKTSNGQSWGNWFGGNQDNTQYAVSLSAFQNILYMAAAGTDQKIYTRSSLDGQIWSEWNKDLDSGTLDTPALSQAVFNNGQNATSRLFLVATGTNQVIYLRYLENGAWSPWHVAEQLTSSSQSLMSPSGPSITTRLFSGENSETLYILARQNNGQILWLFVRQV